MRFPRLRRFVLGKGLLLLPLILRAYARTMRIRRPDVERLRTVLQKGPVIYAFMHNRILMMPFSIPLEKPFRPVDMMISASDDGSLISEAVRGLHIEPVRGSSSRQGTQARNALLESLQNGHNVGITPDGPKGPMYQVQPGVVWLARETGAPIISLTSVAKPCIRVGSWDRFIVPLPFAKVVFRFGRPLYLDRSTDFAEATKEVEAYLKSAIAELDPGDPVVL